MKNKVEVVVKYNVDGSVSAAKAAIEERYSRFLPGLQEFKTEDFHAKKYSVDANPQEVCNYRNYETFQVATFISNNRRQYDLCLLEAAEVFTNDAWPTPEEKVSALARRLEEKVSEVWLGMNVREEACAKDIDYLAHVLLCGALDRVDWFEIADEWLTTAKEAGD